MKLMREQKSESNECVENDTLKLVVSATFTSEPIEDYIKWWCIEFNTPVDIQFAPYNQVFQELLSTSSLISGNTGLNLLLIRFEDWIRNESSDDQVKLEILERNFTELVAILESKKKIVPYFAGVFPVSTHLALSDVIVNFIEEMNVRWTARLRNIEDIYIIDFNQAFELYHMEQVFDQAKDHAGHIPFTDEFFAVMGTMIARKLCAWIKQVFKVIALDCDNTLWKGICGESTSLENSSIGARVHAHAATPTNNFIAWLPQQAGVGDSLGIDVASPYRELQRFMLQKYNEGMLLTLCSKNNENDVWEVFTNNQQMLLKKEHFAAYRINWKAKSQNLRELADELNLGIDSFIFLDDNPVECAEVMSNCPEILTLQLPEDQSRIKLFLDHVWAFDKLKVTNEDRVRTQMYMAEKQRQASQKETVSLDDFLKGLEIRMSMNIMEKQHIGRVAQLTQRTNQFNLSVIRRTEKEINDFLYPSTTKCRVIEVSDRFGDYGLVGVVITEEKEEGLFIETLLLSCRVLGKSIEDSILVGLAQYCREIGLEFINAKYYPTSKNKPVLEFLERIGFEKKETTESYIKFTIAVDRVPFDSKFVECYFNSSYLKKEPVSDEKDSARELSCAHTKSNVMEAKDFLINVPNWKINMAEREHLLHKKYLYPLTKCTVKDLVELPGYKGRKTRLAKTAYVAPRNELEVDICRIWQKVLKVDRVGIDDPFFELGGNSLLAIKLGVELEKNGFQRIAYDLINQWTTIRQIVAVLSGNGEEIPVQNENKAPELNIPSEMSIENVSAQKVVINGIKPFNDVYYKSCFYNSVFPVLELYGVSINSFLANEVSIYSYDEKSPGMKLGIEYIKTKTIAALLKEKGVKVRTKFVTKNIIGDIIHSLHQQRPVVIWIDCFYESLRPEMYQLTHWPHTLLIYGYDESEKLFNIIEHPYRDNLSYEKCAIGFDDAEKAYNGYLHNFKTGDVTYYEFYKDSTRKKKHVRDEDIHQKLKNTYLSNIAKSQKKILKRLECVNRFSASFVKLITEKPFLDEIIEELLNGINNIINVKKVEEYKIRNLFGANAECYRMLEEVIDNWTFIRGVVAKYVYTSEYIPDDFLSLKKNLSEIFEAENQYYNALTSKGGYIDE